jgi:NAD(P)-dependent dehydrogenase (short-subunit alcohol dehydrogenase family)
MAPWTTADIPPQHGRSAVVTGTGGLGFEDALALARAGADVTVAGRSLAKGAEAVAEIRRQVPGAAVRFERLDLASLASVAHFGERMRAERDGLDLLINNAGVMAPARRQTTEDGFELQLGTNHLGHVALTAHLLPLLLKSRAPRVVSLSSIAARGGRIRLDDLQAERGYIPMVVYSQSKLATLMFALELDRRSRAAGWGLASVAAHPGVANTSLITNQMGPRSLFGLAERYARPLFFQSAAQGALPTLYAATAPEAESGGYYGPSGLFEARGWPVRVNPPRQARNQRVAAALWEQSERLCGVSFEQATANGTPA